MAFCENLECWQLKSSSSQFCKDHQTSARLDLSGLSNVQLNSRTAPLAEFSKAVALTQTAINNLGAPIHASMIDHKPVDVALAQALTQTAIAKQGEKHVDAEKLPKDRAIAEALTLTAISHQPQDKLKQTGRRSSLDETVGLTPEQQHALLDEAKAEKDRIAAARVFGGGDPKEAMANILDEISHQGIIAVPHDKVPDENITLNQIKTLAQINALQEGGVNLTHTEQPVDHSLLQAQTLKALSSESAKAHLKHTEAHPVDTPLAHSKVVYAIDHMGEPHLKHEEHNVVDPSLVHGQTMYAIGHHQRKSSIPSDKVFADKALAEALTLNALGSEAPKAHLKPVEHPHEGLTPEALAALQAAAQQEKTQEPESESSDPTPVFHFPKTE